MNYHSFNLGARIAVSLTVIANGGGMVVASFITVASLQGEPRSTFYRLILNMPVNRRGVAMNLASDREIDAHFDCPRKD